MSDLRAVVSQLQRDMRNEVGALNSRPASVLFQSWIDKAHAIRRHQREAKPQAADSKTVDDISVVPLSIFQLADTFQMNNLFRLVADLPDLVRSNYQPPQSRVTSLTYHCGLVGPLLPGANGISGSHAASDIQA